VKDGVKFLEEGALEGLLRRLSERARVWVPVEATPGVVLWRPWREGEKVRLDRQGTEPPKHVLFPRSETLLRIYEKEELKIEEVMPQGPSVIFGARPCDVRGFEVFDQVFGEEDPYYSVRRRETTILTVLCTEPERTCFCTTVGGGPLEEKGSDVTLLWIEGGWLAQAVTERGEEVLRDEAFVEASREQIEKGEQRKEAVKLDPVVDLSGIPEKFLESFTSDFWRRVTAKCISCGACTFLCPTCYCFNITDERTPEGAERLRSWDACMFYHYTLEASGHNPRPTKAERYRNRIGHKFSYHPSNHGTYGCTGCGRCIKYCPVGMDVREILRELKEYAEG